MGGRRGVDDEASKDDATRHGGGLGEACGVKWHRRPGSPTSSSMSAAGGGLAMQNGASCDAVESARAPRTAADAPRTAADAPTSFLAPRRPRIVARWLAKSVGTAMRVLVILCLLQFWSKS